MTKTSDPLAPCGYCRRCAIHDDPGGCLTVEAYTWEHPEVLFPERVRDRQREMTGTRVSYTINAEEREGHAVYKFGPFNELVSERDVTYMLVNGYWVVA